MFCSNCGKEVAEGAKFCPNCGTSVGSAGVEIKQEKAVNFIQTQPSALPASGVYQAQNTPITADEKYCFSCGAVIKKAAALCPKCGVNQSMRSSTTSIDVYCSSCGKSIKKEAAVCPFCGVGQEAEKTGTKNKTTAIILWCFALHRFYVGKIGTGILYLLTFGGIGIWTIIDIIYLLTDKFTDAQGKLLKKN
jgi:RNA polymerase subunit RPABC4/transcription elongation factor Spt4